jgi:hypothetical protein
VLSAIRRKKELSATAQVVSEQSVFHIGEDFLMLTILLIILVIVVLGGGGGYYGYNRYGNGGLGGALGLVIIVLLVLWLVGAFHGGAAVPPA